MDTWSKFSSLSQHFRTLGLAPTASKAQCAESHRRLIRKWHPDKYAMSDPRYWEALERSKSVNAAFNALCRERFNIEITKSANQERSQAELERERLAKLKRLPVFVTSLPSE